MAAVNETPTTVTTTTEVTAPGYETVPADTVEHNRIVGPVSTSAGAGSALGGAIATLIVAVFALDLDATAAAALATVVSSVLAVFGGYLAPSQKGQFQSQIADALALTLTERTEIAEAAARNAATLAIPDVRGLVVEEIAKATTPTAEVGAEDDDREAVFAQYPTAL